MGEQASELTKGIVATEVVVDEPEAKYLDMKLHDDYVACVPLEATEKVGSVWLAGQKKSPFHRVVATSGKEWNKEDERWEAMRVEVGDKVLLGGYAGVDLDHDEVSYRLVHATDIVATFPED